MRRPKEACKEAAVTPLPYCNKRRREARILAAVGIPEVGIAEFFGITVAALEAWKREHPELMASIRSGREALFRGGGLDSRWRQEAFVMLEQLASREAAQAEKTAQGRGAEFLETPRARARGNGAPRRKR